MDVQSIIVADRRGDLLRLATSLRLERQERRRRGQRPGGLRRAIGRRLVALGSSLLDEPTTGLAAPSR